jgi:predicted nucleic-acid-binding protein
VKALDTNVLVRFLVNDDKKMAAKAVQLLNRAHDRGDQFFVSTPVLLEMLWVLRAVYGLSRKDILDAYEKLTSMPVLQFESSDLVHAFVHTGGATGLDLSDILIGLHHKDLGCDKTLTLDKGAAKYDLFESVG